MTLTLLKYKVNNALLLTLCLYLFCS